MTRTDRDPGWLGDELRSLPVVWKPQQSLAALTSLGVGGAADLVVVRDAEALPPLIDLLRRRELVWRFLGGGSNLLVADEGLSAIIVQLAPQRDGVKLAGSQAEVSAAADLGRTVTECAKNHLGGMEGLIGVPGTVGGALRMNAGAYGTQIGERVKSVRVFQGTSGELKVLKPGGMKFTYRHSSFSSSDIMLSVTLELLESPYEEIVAKIKRCNQKRRASQPINQRSAGCIFKNPPGLSTGKMIDELGMKGLRMGGAMISDRHANFIVNRQEGTAADIFRLMDLIRERVLKAYAVELAEEVIVWRDAPRG